MAYAKKRKYISDSSLLLSEWDWEKNVISPYETSYGSAKKCFWKCSSCGFCWSTPAYVRGSQGCGCPQCAKIKRGKNKKISSAIKNNFLEKYPEIAKEWHPTRNVDYDIKNVSSCSNINVWWLCSKCGNEWKTKVGHRTIGGTNCPKCSKEQSAQAKVKFHANAMNFAKNFPEIAEEWNYEKNGELTPSSISVHSNKKVWWKCSFCGNEWKTTVSHRTYGQNCPACNKYQTSFPEQAIFYYVKMIYQDAQNRHKISGVEFDIYIPSRKIAIEYDGKYFHKNKTSLKKDNCKDRICKELGIALYRFRDETLLDTDSAIRITCADGNLDSGIEQLINMISNKQIDIDAQKDRYQIN